MEAVGAGHVARALLRPGGLSAALALFRGNFAVDYEGRDRGRGPNVAGTTPLTASEASGKFVA